MIQHIIKYLLLWKLQMIHNLIGKMLYHQYLHIRWLLLSCALTRDWTHNHGLSGHALANWATRPAQQYILVLFWLFFVVFFPLPFIPLIPSPTSSHSPSSPQSPLCCPCAFYFSKFPPPPDHPPPKLCHTNPQLNLTRWKPEQILT